MTIKPQAGDYIHKEDIESEIELAGVLSLLGEDFEGHIRNYRNEDMRFLVYSDLQGWCWSENKDDDFVRWIYPKDLLANSNTEGHPRSDLLRQIADAMDETPDGWINEFEFQLSTGEWIPVACEPDVFWEWFKQRECRRKPKTVHIEGEVPEKLFEEAKFLVKAVDDTGAPDSDRVRFARALLSLRAAGETDE